jgi:hypothetical protein
MSLSILACPQAAGKYYCDEITDEWSSRIDIDLKQWKSNGVDMASLSVENSKAYQATLDGQTRIISINGDQAYLKASCIGGRQILLNVDMINDNTWYKVNITQLSTNEVRVDLKSNSFWVPTTQYICKKRY